MLSPKLWSPESPFLYNMTVTAGVDSVGSYFGMREVALGKDSKGTTICLQTSRVKFQDCWWLYSFSASLSLDKD